MPETVCGQALFSSAIDSKVPKTPFGYLIAIKPAGRTHGHPNWNALAFLLGFRNTKSS